ncbi:MAG TPA: hypothetical protein VM076_13560 [Gemmatimonadaceae bacterium]|nr:hypothetical protein [Gemmatimonadaceae bacterium]
MSSATFSPIHLVPDGRAMLACSCVVPDGWVRVPVPDDSYDFDNPAVFLPLLVCMAPYGAVVFTVAARPRFDDGTVEDWATYLAAQNNLQVERIREARVNRMPCILVDATMPSDAGLMRSRSVFLEDGRRLFNVGTLAPDAIWASLEADFDHLLGAFKLGEVSGITAAPLRLMTSEPALDLTTTPGPPKSAASPAAVDAPAPVDDFKAFIDVEPNEVAAAPEPPAQDPEFAGQPAWWRTAVLLERADRLEEAEQTILKAVDHIGAYSSVAYLYEERYARLARAGRDDDARVARARAIEWLRSYAGSATSGGEGAALSLERDQRIAALGG